MDIAWFPDEGAHRTASPVGAPLGRDALVHRGAKRHRAQGALLRVVAVAPDQAAIIGRHGDIVDQLEADGPGQPVHGLEIANRHAWIAGTQPGVELAVAVAGEITAVIEWPVHRQVEGAARRRYANISPKATNNASTSSQPMMCKELAVNTASKLPRRP